MIIPSIDILNGEVVQLRQGKEVVYRSNDIESFIKKYKLFPEVNVIDLNGAISKDNNNKELIYRLCKELTCNVGGGIRNAEIANEYIERGANKVIIGTCATKEFLSQVPKEKLIVALDVKDGKIATEGWKKLDEENDFISKIAELESYCSKFLITNVDVEGLNKGTDLSFFKRLKSKTKNDIMVAGGITTIEEIKEIHSYGFDQVLGMAITSGRLDIYDCYTSIIDFDKQDGLIPTIVQDIDTKEVLMLAYSSKESFKLAFTTNYGIYYSRSRQKLWKKGEESGNVQELEKIYLDCDSDTLLFLVRQKGKACHRMKRTCFEV